tara:strand:- start:26807 stop:27667 length:861 start_codon:yes stop_codon:yes gene_type:complete
MQDDLVAKIVNAVDRLNRNDYVRLLNALDVSPNPKMNPFGSNTTQMAQPRTLQGDRVEATSPGVFARNSPRTNLPSPIGYSNVFGGSPITKQTTRISPASPQQPFRSQSPTRLPQPTTPPFSEFAKNTPYQPPASNFESPRKSGGNMSPFGIVTSPQGFVEREETMNYEIRIGEIERASKQIKDRLDALDDMDILLFNEFFIKRFKELLGEFDGFPQIPDNLMDGIKQNGYNQFFDYSISLTFYELMHQNYGRLVIDDYLRWTNEFIVFVQNMLSYARDILTGLRA